MTKSGSLLRGVSVGVIVGVAVFSAGLDIIVAVADGLSVGNGVGVDEGAGVEVRVGFSDGISVGDKVGLCVGVSLGAEGD